jgi:dihydroflavonol-4-reductase
MTKHSKILVAGGQGFIGSYILRRLLEAGYTSVHSLDNRSDASLLSKEWREKVNWHQCDLRDLGQLEDILAETDAVIHAAQPHPWSMPSNAYRIRDFVDGTQNLVNLSLDTGVKKLIHISSVDAIGIRKQHEEISEKQIFSHSLFDSRYGLGTFLSEQEVWRAHAEGLAVTILNPSFVLGAGAWLTSSPRLWQWLASQPFSFPGGSTGWVDVRDVADAVEKALNGNYDGKRYILSAENHSYARICNTICDLIRVRPPYAEVNRPIQNILGPLKSLYARFAPERFFFHGHPATTYEVQATFTHTESRQHLGITYRPIDACLQETSVLFLQRKTPMKEPRMLDD